MLIAIEGIDGSGKGTQAAALRDRLLADGRTATVISFPRYEHTHFGRAIGRYLNGEFGTLAEVHPLLASLLFAGDRFESSAALDAACCEREYVILDRYVASNIAHQAARVDDEQARVELIRWIETLEYDVYRLPRADLTVLLDVPAETAQQLVAKKSQRAYTERPADLHEADLGYLQAVRRLYRELARSPGWKIVDCIESGSVRSIDSIARDVAAMLDAARN